MEEDGRRYIKMELKLVHCNDEVLRTKTPNFDFSDPPVDPRELAAALTKKMMEENGLGLAANQVGLPYRVFIMAANPPLAIFNPRIVDTSTEQVMLEEGCLSYPNLFIKIKRPKIIKVRFNDMDGVVHTEKFTGMTARIFQHELDHLDGLDYTKRAHNIHYQRAMNKKKLYDRALKNKELANV